MQLLDLRADGLPALVCRAAGGPLSKQGQGVSTYWWRSADGGQHFCRTCGIAVIRTSTAYPPPLSINARCIEGIELGALTIRQIDGKHLYP